jgi:hypothetical protein
MAKVIEPHYLISEVCIFPFSSKNQRQKQQEDEYNSANSNKQPIGLLRVLWYVFIQKSFFMVS